MNFRQRGNRQIDGGVTEFHIRPASIPFQGFNNRPGVFDVKAVMPVAGHLGMFIPIDHIYQISLFLKLVQNSEVQLIAAEQQKYRFAHNYSSSSR